METKPCKMYKNSKFKFQDAMTCCKCGCCSKKNPDEIDNPLLQAQREFQVNGGTKMDHVTCEKYTSADIRTNPVIELWNLI